MHNDTLLNLCSEYVRIAQRFRGILERARGLRTEFDVAGLTRPHNHPQGTGEGPAMQSVSFPLPGELSHIESKEDLTQLVAALETLESTLMQPITVDGKTTIVLAAISKLNRGIVQV